MSDLIPIVLAVILAALLLLEAGVSLRGGRVPAVPVGIALLGLGAAAAVSAMVLDAHAILPLPAGPPGIVPRLSIDAAAAWFLLLVFLAGAAVLGAHRGEPTLPPGLLSGIAGLALAIVAGDPITGALGLAIAGLAAWASAPIGAARGVPCGLAIVAALTFLAATALAPPGAPNATWAPLLLGLAGAGALAATVIRPSGLPPGAVIPAATCLLMRATLAIPAATPLAGAEWPVLAAGIATTIAAGWCAVTAPALGTIMAMSALHQAGLATLGIGLALLARASDLPEATSLAIGAVLLLSAAQALCGTSSAWIAAVAAKGGGSDQLRQLGGLFHRMPFGGSVLLASLLSLAAIPPGPGFAGYWLMAQAILNGPRGGTLPTQLGLLAAALALGLAGALAAMTAIRVVGIVFLGRPRLFRAAGANDIPRPARPALLAAAALSAALGLLPAAALTGLGAPGIRLMSRTALNVPGGILTLAQEPGGPGYAPLPIAVLIALVVGGPAILWRRSQTVRRGLFWNGGFAVPAMPPFDEPLAQATGEGFAPMPPPLPSLPRTRRVRFRLSAATGIPLLAAAAACMLLAALLGRGA